MTSNSTHEAGPSLVRVPPTRREGLTNLALLLGAHAALVTFWVVTFTAPFGLLLLLAAPVACLLHQKAISEWMHEAAHWNFLASRKWNDRLIELLAGAFFLESIDEHRRKHFTHHRGKGFFAEADLDTASVAVHNRRELLRGVFRDLTGLTAFSAVFERGVRGVQGPAGHASRHARLAAFGACAYIGITLLLAWLVPGPAVIAPPFYLLTLATVYPLFNRFRVYAQHAELGEHGTVLAASTASRTIVVHRLNVMDRFVVSSKVMVFHAEHHEHPTLPYRQLEQLAVPSDDVNRYATSRLALLARLYRELPA